MIHPSFADGSFAHLRLGRAPDVPDPRTLRLENYLDVAALPPPPPSCDYTVKVPRWPMYGNDELGDCTVAAAGHMVEAWSYTAGHPKAPTVSTVERAYWETGNPPSATGTPNGPTDTGRMERAVLNYWRKTGIGRDHILAYAAVPISNVELVKTAIHLFGGVYTGIGLPLTAQRQAVWDVVGDGRSGASAPWSWGGHAVPYHAYDEHGVTLVTWGGLLKATWAFHLAYTEEVYALVNKDWIDRSGKTPSGLNMAALMADLSAISR